MRKEDLLESFGALDDDLLMRIENGSKTIMIWKAVKYGTMTACLMAILGMAYMFGVNRLIPRNDPISDPLQGKPIEEITTVASQEAKDLSERKGGKVEELNSGAVKEGAIKDGEICFNLASIGQAKLKESVKVNICYCAGDQISEVALDDMSHELMGNVGVSWQVLDVCDELAGDWSFVRYYKLFENSPWGQQESGPRSFVFLYGREDETEKIKLSFCYLEESLRDYWVLCENPVLSKVCDTEVMIYSDALSQNVICQFQKNGTYCDVEYSGTGMEETQVLNLLQKVMGLIANSGHRNEAESGSEVQTNLKDIPADGNGEYIEVNDNDILAKEISDFYGGSYLDTNGRFTIVLTEDTPENRAAICREFGRNEDKTAFVTGKYTLKYLTELQEKISNGMINKELSFVLSSAVRETSNGIVVCVTTDDEAELAKLYGLDLRGGAIKVEYSDGIAEYIGVLE